MESSRKQYEAELTDLKLKIEDLKIQLEVVKNKAEEQVFILLYSIYYFS